MLLRQAGPGSCQMAAVQIGKQRYFHCVAAGLPHVAQCGRCMMAVLQRGALHPAVVSTQRSSMPVLATGLHVHTTCRSSLTRMTDPNSCPTTITQNGWLSRPKTA